MEKISLSDKGKIDLCVKKLACSNFRRITAPYVKKCSDIENIDTVRSRLFQLKGEGILRANFDIICPECYEDLKTYHDESDLPLGEEIFCVECNKYEIISAENIWINFSPNKEYYSKNMCKNTKMVKKNQKIKN